MDQGGGKQWTRRLYQHDTIGPGDFAREIDDEPWWRRQKTPLICAFCMTPVVSQRTTVGRHPRGALFRLAKDRQHTDVCPLNPTEVLQKIARGSQGAAVIEGDELHLVLPDDMSQIGTTLIADTGAAAPGDRFGVDISTVRPLLPPLINSGVVIARFLQKYDYDADVVAQFKVRRPGEAKAVGWGEFCHGPASSDHARLYARLTGGPKPRHPVAVYGRVTAVEHDSQDRPVLRLADGHGFAIRIRSEHASLLTPLTAGTFVLAVGTWKIWTPRRGRPELQMFAEEHWQLAHWTYDNATGRNGPPACPPLSLAQRALRQARAAAASPKPVPGRATGPSPRPRPSRLLAPAAPPPSVPPPAPPTTPVPPTAASSAQPPPPPLPALPDAVDSVQPAPAPPAHPPLPPTPPSAPPPAAPPRRHRRWGRWWPFNHRP